MHYTSVSSSWHLIICIDDMFKIEFPSTSTRIKFTLSPQSQIVYFMKLIMNRGTNEQLERYFILENIIFQNTI